LLRDLRAIRFDDENRIRHLDIDEQAKDTGGWIVEAAKGAAGTGATQCRSQALVKH